MNHPDWPAFLAAICAEPDDDTPRLVAADFLDENGEHDRAAFIRLQIELERVDASGGCESPEADELCLRLQKYGPQSLFRSRWTVEDCPELVRVIPPKRTGSPLTHPHVEGADRLQWFRGFVERIYCPADEWLRHGAEVRKRNPFAASR